MTDRFSDSRREFLKRAGVASVALSGLAGCSQQTGPGTPGSDGTVTGTTGENRGAGQLADEITFYNAGSLQYDPGTERNIERFQEATGITVNTNEVPWANLKTSLTTAWRNESNEVDAFNGPTWWLADFVSADWISPLNLSSDHMSKFPQNLTRLTTFDGSAYMAPQLGKWGTFLYDDQYLSDQGVDAPDTWQDLIDLGDQLSGQEKQPFAFTWANKDVFTFKQFLYQAGGQLFAENDEPAFVEEGVTVFRDLIGPLRERNMLPSGIANMGEGPVGDAFVGDQLAMVESWTPLGNRALEADGWDPDRLGAARPPAGPASRATFQDTNGIAVSAFSDKKGAAREFAEFMSSTESLKTDMLVEGNPAPAPDLYDDPEIRSEYPSDLLDQMKYNLENARSETYLAQPQVDEYLSNAITPALLGKEEPRAALENAQEQIRGLYQNIGLL